MEVSLTIVGIILAFEYARRESETNSKLSKVVSSKYMRIKDEATLKEPIT